MLRELPPDGMMMMADLLMQVQSNRTAQTQNVSLYMSSSIVGIGNVSVKCESKFLSRPLV
jgi:hypothetical protein